MKMWDISLFQNGKPLNNFWCDEIQVILKSKEEYAGYERLFTQRIYNKFVIWFINGL